MPRANDTFMSQGYNYTMMVKTQKPLAYSLQAFCPSCELGLRQQDLARHKCNSQHAYKNSRTLGSDVRKERERDADTLFLRKYVL